MKRRFDERSIIDSWNEKEQKREKAKEDRYIKQLEKYKAEIERPLKTAMPGGGGRVDHECSLSRM